MTAIPDSSAKPLLSLTVQEAARLTGMSKTRVFNAIREGQLDGRRAGKRTFILADSLRAFVAGLPPSGGSPKQSRHR